MASVSGTYTIHDVSRITPELQRRLCSGRQPNRWALLLGAIVICYFGFHIIWGQHLWDELRMANLWPESAPDWVVGVDNFIGHSIGSQLFGALLMIGLFVWIIRRSDKIAKNTSRPTLEERGISGPIPWTTTLTPEAMIADDGDVRRIVKWQAIAELFTIGDFWIFVVQTSTDIVDRRCFVDIESERAFIAEALSYMSEAARARSNAAVKFAAGA